MSGDLRTQSDPLTDFFSLYVSKKEKTQRKEGCSVLCVHAYTWENIEAMDVLKDSWLLERRWTSPWLEPESRIGPDWLLTGGR